MNIFRSAARGQRLLLLNIVFTITLPHLSLAELQGKELPVNPMTLSHRPDRRPINFLPGSWSEERRNASPAARASIVVAHV